MKIAIFETYHFEVARTLISLFDITRKLTGQ